MLGATLSAVRLTYGAESSMPAAAVAARPPPHLPVFSFGGRAFPDCRRSAPVGLQPCVGVEWSSPAVRRGRREPTSRHGVVETAAVRGRKGKARRFAYYPYNLHIPP